MKIIEQLIFVTLAGLSLSAAAQTINLASGVQKYAFLTGATVDMTGKCELWVTNAATPLSGCVINLNSADAWLFLPGVRPSAVASTYLGQVRVSGASAVADGNVRVVQYGQNGAVVIPQAATFQPLTVYAGPEFTGAATSYGQWTYYTGAAYTNISSFKLKRGYLAVLAQSANGASYSQCYIAQDGDLEVGVLPATLSQQVQFIYVTPWRWTSKKGIAGNPPYADLNVNWWYDWNIDQSSSRDLEYVPIRLDRWWPSLGQNWQSLGANTVLGYNEPDNTSQSDIAVGDAVWSWPDVLATGLRVGSPACTDGGVSSWLLPFVSEVSTNLGNEAGAAGMRVDFVAQHYYQAADPANPSACASQMYNFLRNIWNNTHKPIWITEWNNGANWTDNSPYAPPTYAQQQADVAAMAQMLESTPFVERYALYNWVGDTRSLVTSSNTVTPAGTVYSNIVSGLAYSQAMPGNGTRGMAQYLFATNTWDSSGHHNNGMAVGAPAYTTGHSSQASAIALDGANSYVQLPANIATNNAFTFAAWVYWNGGAAWQRIFDFGAVSTQQGGAPYQYLFLTPGSGSGTLRFAITASGNGNEQRVETAALPSGSWQHVAVTLNGTTGILYVNGAPVATNSILISPATFSPAKNYLGKSQFSADPLFNGKLDEVEIADYAMTPAQIAALGNSPQYPSGAGGIWLPNTGGAWSAGSNWNNGFAPDGAGFIADFSTLNILGNTTVTLDSPRTIGGLKFGDTIGLQNWTLAGGNTLTLDAGGNHAPTIVVNQNTATLATPLAGANGFTKAGNGTLTLTGTNAVGGGLTVSAGAVNLAGGTTMFGGGTSSIGYLTGSGSLALTAGALSLGGELRVGGSDQDGTQYNATGAVTLANATLSVGSLTVARGNYLDNSISGTLTLNGGSTLIVTNDVIAQFAGAGRGKVAINGGTCIVGPVATKWFMVGYYDSGAGEVDVYSGNLFLENGSSIKLCRGGNTGGNVFNQYGGNVTFYSDAGMTVGGGNLDLNYAGGSSSSSTYNLNGGTLTVPKIIATSGNGAGTFNFNGGTLKPAADNSAFMQGLTAAKVLVNGVKIDTAGCNITIAQALLAGDAGSGGLTKNGGGTLTLAGSNTYTGDSSINAGALALGDAGSLASSANIIVAGGAWLDVTAVGGGFTLGAAQTLSGNGAVNGTVANNGTIAPGAAGTIGALTFSNSPVLNGVSLIKVNRNNGAPLNDQIRLPVSAVTYGGTLTVTNVGAPLQAGDAFQLFSATGYGGAFAVTNLPPLGDGLAWSNSLAVNGTIAVVSPVSLIPANILYHVSGTNLLLSWPADHIGWRLQAQTNALNAGLGDNWVDVPGSSVTDSVTLPVNADAGSVFYRLTY